MHRAGAHKKILLTLAQLLLPPEHHRNMKIQPPVLLLGLY
jgi:hypothetical protein